MARFVKFEDTEGSCYYGTYTAYDGRLILPQLIETEDFQRFRFSTLNGPAVKNKGMALFPRKVRGSYAMISRQDNENIHLMYSDNPHFWHESEIIIRPQVSLGAGANRKLRVSHRDRGRLAADQPRRGAFAQVLPGSLPARP